MANYQPKVSLAWKYLKNAVAPNPNLKIVWTVEVDVAQGELIQFSTASLRDAVVILSTGGNRTGSFSEEWDAPYNVERNLDDNALNRDKIKGQIEVNGPIKVTSTFKKDGVIVGETINQSTHNGNIQWG